MAQRLLFASKVDGWLAGVIVAAALLSAMAIVSVTQLGLAYAAAALLLIGIPGMALPIWVLFGTRYEVTDDELIVRGGPFRWRVPVHKIRAIEPSQSWLSGPALSLDRLRVDYGLGRCLLVSPKERDRFLSSLVEVGKKHKDVLS